MLQEQNKELLDDLLGLKRESEAQKAELLAEIRKSNENADRELALQIGRREDRLKEQQVIHEGEIVTLKDRLTKQIVELERKLEGL